MERTGKIIQFAIPPPSLARLPNCFSIAKPGREIKYYPVNVPPFVVESSMMGDTILEKI